MLDLLGVALRLGLLQTIALHVQSKNHHFLRLPIRFSLYFGHLKQLNLSKFWLLASCYPPLCSFQLFLSLLGTLFGTTFSDFRLPVL